MKWGDTPYRIMGFGSVGSNMGGWGFSISVPAAFVELARAEKRPAVTESVLQEHCRTNWPKHMPHVAGKDGELKDLYDLDLNRAYWFEDDNLMLKHLTVPGDACGLDPGDGFGAPWPNSFSWLPHNVDSQGQATALLHMWLRWFDAVESVVTTL